MNLKLALIAAVVALSILGCANRCNYALTKCHYLCSRGYETCQLQGHDEPYCQNEYRNCWVECDAQHNGCRS